MKKITGMIFLLSSVFSLAQEARVIPVVFGSDEEQKSFEKLDYVEVAYFLTPDGEPVFEEMAEKVWRVQERSFLILGSTGEPLPGNLVRRAELYVQVYADGQPLFNHSGKHPDPCIRSGRPLPFRPVRQMVWKASKPP